MPWSIRMTLMIAAAGLLFHFYVAGKIAGAIGLLTPWSVKRIRWTAAAAVVFLVLYPIVTVAAYLGGSVQASGLLFDLVITYPFWVGLVASVQLAMLFIALDIAAIFLFLLYKRDRARRQRLKAIVIIAILCITVPYVVLRVYRDTSQTTMVQTELSIPGLHNDLDGLRIVQIADMQVDAYTNGAKLDRYIEAVNKLEPDLILFCGDLVTSGTQYIEQAAAAMARMRARHGTYVCLGDHDYFSDRQAVVRNLSKHFISVIDDAIATVPVGSTHVTVTGITNVYRNRASTKTIEDIETERAASPLSIFFTHQPSPWLVKIASESDYDLFLAGHTHGGQVVFYIPGLRLAGSRIETPYVTGFHQLGKMMISINNGLGMTLAPIRYQAPSQVTLITVRRGKEVE